MYPSDRDESFRVCLRFLFGHAQVGVAQFMTQAPEYDAIHSGGFVLLANWRNDGKQVESAFIDDRRPHREDQISR
jgi:hypothetical protein